MVFSLETVLISMNSFTDTDNEDANNTTPDTADAANANTVILMTPPRSSSEPHTANAGVLSSLLPPATSQLQETPTTVFSLLMPSPDDTIAGGHTLLRASLATPPGGRGIQSEVQCASASSGQVEVATPFDGGRVSGGHGTSE